MRLLCTCHTPGAHRVLMLWLFSFTLLCWWWLCCSRFPSGRMDAPNNGGPVAFHLHITIPSHVLLVIKKKTHRIYLNMYFEVLSIIPGFRFVHKDYPRPQFFGWTGHRGQRFLNSYRCPDEPNLDEAEGFLTPFLILVYTTVPSNTLSRNVRDGCIKY